MLRVDLHFDLDRSRWSEDYYFDQPSDKLRAALDRVVGHRARLMATPCVLTHGTSEIVGQRGSRISVRYNRTNVFNGEVHKTLTKHWPEYQASAASYALGVGFRGQLGGERMLWISGLPDSGRFTGSKIYRSVLSHFVEGYVLNYVFYLLHPTLNLHLRILDPVERETAPGVINIDSAESGLYRITTAIDHGFQPGDQVRVLGSKGHNLTRCRGLRRVVDAPTPRQVVIDRGPLPEKGPIRYTAGATLAGTSYLFTKAIWQPLAGIGFTNTPTGLFTGFHSRGVFIVGSKLRGGGTPPRRGRNTNRPDR